MTFQGRHLRPVNFNQEIFLEVNLGPTYLSEPLVQEVFALRKKEYLYKEDNQDRLIQAYRKVNVNYGAAIATFRRKQAQKSRFPESFWK